MIWHENDILRWRSKECTVPIQTGFSIQYYISFVILLQISSLNDHIKTTLCSVSLIRFWRYGELEQKERIDVVCTICSSIAFYKNLFLILHVGVIRDLDSAFYRHFILFWIKRLQSSVNRTENELNRVGVGVGYTL